MYKKKSKARPQMPIETKAYVPKEDKHIYIYKQKTHNRFMLVPYKYKVNYQYIKKLLNNE